VTEHQRIFAWDAGVADEEDLRGRVAALFEAAIEGDPATIRACLMETVHEYVPTNPSRDLAAAVEPAVKQAAAWTVPVPTAVLIDGQTPPWKRTLDLVVGSTAALVAAPVAAGIVLAKVCTGRRPLLVREERIGLNRRLLNERRRQGDRTPIDRRRRERRGRALPGRPLVCWRFATTAADDPRRGAARHVDAFLRDYRLDKLPYLFSILKGDLSLVGPKPEKLSMVGGLRWESGAYAERFLVVPGLTGPAQTVRCPDHHQEGFSRRVEYDLFYVHHRSLGLDLRMLARTIPVLLAGRHRASEAWRSSDDRLAGAAMTGSGGLRN
jgi:lipopolysaccharide/colanic/teichoic acid biosynthesis glycosyltransferase